MNLKPGVSLDGLKPEILKILPLVELLYKQAGSELTITCTTGSHGELDPHPHGYAVDSRTAGLSNDRCYALKNAIQNALGPKYYVQYEEAIVKDGRVIRGAHIHTQLRKDLWRKNEGIPLE